MTLRVAEYFEADESPSYGLFDSVVIAPSGLAIVSAALRTSRAVVAAPAGAAGEHQRRGDADGGEGCSEPHCFSLMWMHDIVFRSGRRRRRVVIAGSTYNQVSNFATRLSRVREAVRRLAVAVGRRSRSSAREEGDAAHGDSASAAAFAARNPRPTARHPRRRGRDLRQQGLHAAAPSSGDRRPGRDDPRRHPPPLRIEGPAAPGSAPATATRPTSPISKSSTSPTACRCSATSCAPRSVNAQRAGHRAGVRRALGRVGDRRPPRPRRSSRSATRQLRGEVAHAFQVVCAERGVTRARDGRLRLGQHPRRHGRTAGAVAARTRRRRPRARVRVRDRGDRLVGADPQPSPLAAGSALGPRERMPGPGIRSSRFSPVARPCSRCSG